MQQFESYIYSKLAAYNPLVHCLEKEDVMQEIRFAILTAEEGKLFRVASSLIRKLARDCGYSRRMGKDNFEAFYREYEMPYDPAQEALLQEVEDLYIAGDMTARDIAQHYNIKFNNALAKRLCEVFPKAMGRGGKRKNAGRKKIKKQMKTCIKCGASILDAQNIAELGYTIESKYCENCRREIRHYRKKSNIVRTEKRRWDNVLFTDFPFEKEVCENEDKYLVYRFGGRRFGRCSWAGVAHSGQVLVFVSREWDQSAPALVRLMTKKHEGGENEYLVIEPAQDTTLPVSRAYYVEDYYKTTMRGLGRDRNLTHTVEGEYDLVLEGTTSSRSGRFGNSFRLLIADNLKIEEEGVA